MATYAVFIFINNGFTEPLEYRLGKMYIERCVYIKILTGGITG